MTFPEMLKEYRTRHGISQEKLARKLDVSLMTVNKWENDKTVPSLIVRKGVEAILSED